MIVGLAPMVLDAALNDFGIHESSEITRAVTGSIAGGALSFLILPLFIQALLQISSDRKLQGESRYARKTE